MKVGKPILSSVIPSEAQRSRGTCFFFQKHTLDAPPPGFRTWVSVPLVSSVVKKLWTVSCLLATCLLTAQQPSTPPADAPMTMMSCPAMSRPLPTPAARQPASSARTSTLTRRWRG